MRPSGRYDNSMLVRLSRLLALALCIFCVLTTSVWATYEQPTADNQYGEPVLTLPSGGTPAGGGDEDQPRGDAPSRGEASAPATGGERPATQKSSGEHYLLLWRAASIWNPRRRARMSLAPRSVELDAGTRLQPQVLDPARPMRWITPTRTVRGTSRVVLSEKLVVVRFAKREPRRGRR